MDDTIVLPKGYELDQPPKTPKGYLLIDPKQYPSKSPEEIGKGFNKGMEEAAPYAGRFLGATLPAVGGMFGGIPGAAAGAAFQQAGKNLAPGFFGEPGSGPEQVLEAGAETALQGVLPSVTESLMTRGFKSTFANAIASKFSPTRYFPATKKATQAAELEGYMNPASAQGDNLAETINVRQVLKKGMKGNQLTNPDAALEELQSPNYHFTISPEVKEGLTDFLSRVPKNSSTADRVINYAKGRLVLSTAGALFGAPFGHTAAAAAGLNITDAILGKLLSNPETAKLVMLAMKTKSTAPEATFLTKSILNAARAAEIPLTVPEQ